MRGTPTGRRCAEGRRAHPAAEARAGRQEVRRGAQGAPGCVSKPDARLPVRLAARERSQIGHFLPCA